MHRHERDTIQLALDILQRAVGLKTETVQFDAVRLALRVLLPYARPAYLTEYWRTAGWKATGQRRKTLGAVFNRIAFDVGTRTGFRANP